MQQSYRMTIADWAYPESRKESLVVRARDAANAVQCFRDLRMAGRYPSTTDVVSVAALAEHP